MNTRLIRTPCLYLVGFMGSGKSTVGTLLADELGWNFADLDVDIETAANQTIPAIFEISGEAEFRRQETDALERRIQRVQRGEPTVLSLGGGAFAQERNYDLIRHNGISIWLDAPIELIKRRIEGQNHRPLARNPEAFEALYQARLHSYARADYRVDVRGDDPRPVVEAVLALPLF